MRGWANNVWGVVYRSCTRAQNGRVNCAPFNFRTSFKASDSEPEPVFDVFLKSAARNDEVSALGRKDDLRVRYPGRANRAAACDVTGGVASLNFDATELQIF